MPTIDSARSWYPASDPVHGFDHVLRVLALAEHLAQVEGADLEIVRAAVLLHDVEGEQTSEGECQPAADDGRRSKHHHASASFAQSVLAAEGWPEGRIAVVQHCIRSHRFRGASEQPQTLEAQILFDADKLDAIGAVGVARAIAYAARAGQPPYAEPSESFLHTGKCQPGEAHSAYHEYIFKLCKLKERLYTLAAKALATERHRLMVEFFERLAEEAKPSCPFPKKGLK
jgi:uncharacterized protein